MNIIEAIQAAENGALITNNFMKMRDHFLKYIKGGLFYEYELVDEVPVFKYDVRKFSMAEIISTGWEVLPINYFNNLLICPQCKDEHTETDCQGYCTASCLQESEGIITKNN